MAAHFKWLDVLENWSKSAQELASLLEQYIVGLEYQIKQRDQQGFSSTASALFRIADDFYSALGVDSEQKVLDAVAEAAGIDRSDLRTLGDTHITAPTDCITTAYDFSRRFGEKEGSLTDKDWSNISELAVRLNSCLDEIDEMIKWLEKFEMKMLAETRRY